MTTDRELMQQALEALERYSGVDQRACDAEEALRERLAQPEQEQVAWEDVLGAIARGWTHDDNKHKTMDVQLAVAIAKEIQDMVIAPTRRKPLTDDRVWLEYMQLWPFRPNDEPTLAKDILRFARAIEAAHGIGEKPDAA